MTQHHTELDTLLADALAANLKANVTSNGNWLLDVHDAGVRLEAIPPQRGRRNGQAGLTIYQIVLRDAKISRPTANERKRVGRIPRAFVEQYVAENGNDATIHGLFQTYSGQEEQQPAAKRSLPLGDISDADYAYLKDRLKTLPRSFYDPSSGHVCESRSEALLKLLRIYDEGLLENATKRLNTRRAE